MKLSRFRLKRDAAPEPSPLGEPPSVLGPDLTAYGWLESSGEVHVHGIVAGDLAAPRVTVGPSGYVEGTVIAEEATVHGRVYGRLIAPTVVVEATAIIEGPVIHHTISVASGATVHGRTPWRPVNYFRERLYQTQGDGYEHVHEARERVRAAHDG